MDKAVIGVRLEPVSLRYGLALLLTQRQVATRYRRRGASPGVPLGLRPFRRRFRRSSGLRR
jgi:hypothetical protein